LGEVAPQVTLLEVLDDVPTDAPVLGHGLDGHVPPQFQGITFEAGGVSAAFVGKRELHLTGLAAGGAPEPLDGQFQPDRLAPDGQPPEWADHRGGPLDHAAAAVAATKGVGVGLDTKHDAPLDKIRGLQAVAAQAPGVVQQARGPIVLSSEAS